MKPQNIIRSSGLALLIISAGCATPQQGPNLDSLSNSMTFNASKDEVWPLVVAEIGMRYPVRVVEKDSGLITTDFANINVGYNNAQMKNYANPPRTLLATWNGMRVTLSTLVTEPEPGKSQVKINAKYEAFEDNVYRAWLACQSNGGLENDILKRIHAQVEARAQKGSAADTAAAPK